MRREYHAWVYAVCISMRGLCGPACMGLCGPACMIRVVKDSQSPNAVRMRRSRNHAKGDHRDCSAANCDAAYAPHVPSGAVPKMSAAAKVAATASFAAAPDIPDERVPGGIEQAVVAFCEALPYAPGDPRALLAQIAVRLARRVDETGAMPAAVRELRVMLMQLTEVPNGPAGPLDEHRLRRAQKRLDAHLAGMV